MKSRISPVAWSRCDGPTIFMFLIRTAPMEPWILRGRLALTSRNVTLITGRRIKIGGSQISPFRIRRRDFWGERWLKHVQTSSYYLRLFRPEKMRYERLVNPVSIADGPVADLTGFLDHYPFSKGMTH